MRSRKSFPARRDVLLLASALALAACGNDDPITGGGAGGGGTDAGTGVKHDASVRDARVTTTINPDGGAPIVKQPTDPATCKGLQCQQTECAGGGTTSISGTIYDPAGKNPLYNIAVYVPNDKVEDLKSGASCDTCESLFTGTPIATAVTDAAGKFTLENAPVGDNIPLVIQVGKWRRQFTIPTVQSCQDNPQADKSLRLPKNHMEGDIPNIAVSTGGADTLECLLRRVGIDASEFVPGDSDAGRIHIFGGAGSITILGVTIGGVPNTNPPGPSSSTALWNSQDSLMKYDIVLLSCEGAETEKMNQQALHDYTDAGGRVFASHFHYSWLNSGPYASENLASWQTGSQDIGDKNGTNGTIVTTLPDGTPFPKGVALQSWLGTTGALQNGELPIQDAKNNAIVTNANTPSQNWIVTDKNSRKPNATQYFSFNTPANLMAGADYTPGTCGRVVYSDLHVGAASNDDPREPIPQSCQNVDLSPQEKALEFMLFDLSSCITPDTAPPAPPIVVAI